MTMHQPLCGSLVALVAVITMQVTTPAEATWSIAISDTETGEVAVGTVTCLGPFDLLAIVPVVVVGKGAAACQAAGDFDGIRRPVIFEQLELGTAPADILAMLEGIGGHQSRQYGITDVNGGAVTFSGSQNFQWAGGVTGTQGTMVYAIQGNILAGDCVVPLIEQAVLETAGDIPEKLMAGMEAARDAGGDGRCSCDLNNPTSCGCPIFLFDKSGHIGGMVVARIGDTDDDDCNASGCVDGDYLMHINVPFQKDADPDPVCQLRELFDAWRADLVGRPDAVQSDVSFSPPMVPPNGTATTTMQISLVDHRQLPITVGVTVDVQHAGDSAGLSTIGAVVDQGNGQIDVTLTSGTSAGTDRFVVTVDDAIRPVVLAPNPSLVYFALGDLDGDGTVRTTDLLDLLAQWGPCPKRPDRCPGDLDGDGMVGTTDLLLLLANWG